MKHVFRFALIAMLALAACAGDTDAGTTASESPGGSSPDASPTETTDASGASSAAALAGTWEGQWNNTTFNSSGDAMLEVAVDGLSYNGTLDLGGNVFGGEDPAPQSFSGTIDPQGATTATFSSEVFGEVTVTIAEDGSVDIEGLDVPAEGVDRFTATGTITAEEISLEYTVFFSDSSDTAVGTLTMTKS